MTSEELARQRQTRATAADELLGRLFTRATTAHAGIEASVAVVAVGGYGRRELSPHSDLDVVLLHEPGLDESLVAGIADAIWYPLWDRGVPLDHSVRDTAGMRAAAARDYRAAMGMLDARSIAGNGAMVDALRSQVLADWRRDARNRLDEVRQARDARTQRAGWIADAAIPNLKESGGGLRDGALLRALVATWLVDVPHAEVEELRRQLLDVRDLVQEATGKRSDRLTPEILPEVAVRMAMSAEQLDLHVRRIGRRTAHLSTLVWRRVDEVTAAPSVRARLTRHLRSGPRLDAIASGVAILDREVVLTVDADPSTDAELALRVAQESASRGLAVSAASMTRLAGGTLPAAPWPRSSNRLMVGFLAAGPGLVSTWNEFDFAGIVDRWLPEWSAIRLRGSAAPIHTFTIDRHSIETCVYARQHLRTVERPDLLVVAALLHDIGKGVTGDHSEVGAPMAEAIALRWGFAADDAVRVGRLVRWHLLLPMAATRRDLEDPATAAQVADIVGDLETLGLLAALTESDARATSAAAWSPWRAGLVTELVARTRAVLLDGVSTPDPGDYEGLDVSATTFGDVPVHVAVVGGSELRVQAIAHETGSLLVVTVVDRLGSMADIAGGLVLAGLEVLSARAVTVDNVATTLWEVSRHDVDVLRLIGRIKAVVEGGLDLSTRFVVADPDDAAGTVASVLDGLSETATLIELRGHDRKGLVWAVCRTIAAAGISIRSAHLSTYGPEVRDVFYVVDSGGRKLGAEAAERLAKRIASAVGGTPAPD